MAKWLTNIIRKAGPEGINIPPIKFIKRLPPKTKDFPKHSRTTILGDSAHTMIPLKGAGANTAIADACDLATLIAQELRRKDVTGLNMAAVLDEYHALMCPRGREIVPSSRAAGKDEAGIMIATRGRGANGSSVGAVA
jgi:2-polyprenyl-6-methoxyphenol hydroxylase-like FAD-dependent oxidoreductase